ncbi:MAG: thiamine pyrophosphate-dependent enzyme [Patescibacteria group bacterium]|jgi:pyruvate ferredoxin oxidoreductase beta subunit
MKTDNLIKPKLGDVLIAPGHRACAGCGQMIAAMSASRGFGPNTIITNATGCLEVTTTPYPESAWKIPWIHSIFENSSSLASGIRAALDYKKKCSGNKKSGTCQIPEKINVIAQGGDGATFDIGIGLISGAWERGDDFLYICYDTEIYSNTGYQASGATQPGASTATTPAGAESIGSAQRKKDMIAIAQAHGLKYIAQSTAGYPEDITRKVKRALELGGPSYIQIMAPCVPGWGIATDSAMSLGKLAAQTGLYPLLEFENGQLIKASKIKEKISVEEYLKPQARFKHLFKSEAGKEEIRLLQKIADGNIEKYKLNAE